MWHCSVRHNTAIHRQPPLRRLDPFGRQHQSGLLPQVHPLNPGLHQHHPPLPDRLPP